MKRICCRNLALLLAALLILLLGGCASGKEQKGAVSDSSGVNASSETDRDLSKNEKEEKWKKGEKGNEQRYVSGLRRRIFGVKQRSMGSALSDYPMHCEGDRLLQ